MDWSHIIEEGIKEVLKNLKDISFEDQTILITGGAGFLGSWMCDVLIKQNARVIALDNFASGLENNVAHLEGVENFRLVKHDISQPIHFNNERIDMVVHMASRASPLEFVKYPIQIIKANTLGTWVALGIAKKHRARFLFTSTSEVYGNPEVVPTPETYNGNVNPIGIRGCYDEAKRAGEAMCIAYMRQHSLDVRIARIFNTYGPRMRADGVYGRAVPRFIKQALNNKPITVFGDGKQTRSFCYVTDQIEGLLRLLWIDDARGEVVNIGNPDEITILELAEIVKKITSSESPIEFYPLPPDDPRRRCPDISKAKELLKWGPKVGLKKGLKKTTEWFIGGKM